MKSVLVFALLALPLFVRAQTPLRRVPPPDTLPGQPYYILLRDGASLRGRIVRQDSTMLTVRQTNGRNTFVERALFERISLNAPDDTFLQTDAIPAPVVQKTRTDTTNRPYLFVLLDGTRLRGTIVRRDPAETVLRTANLGDVVLRTDQIVSLSEVASLEEPVAVAVCPQWLPFVPTAFSAEPGRWYYRNTWLLVNQFEYGLTKNLSIGSTIYLLPTVYAIGLNLKYSFPVADRLRLGVSGQVLATRYETLNGSRGGLNSGAAVGIFQAFGTYGTVRSNVTLGLGTSTANGSFGRSGFVSVGLMQPLGRKVTFVSQATFLVGTVANQIFSVIGGISAGVRLASRSHAFEISFYGLTIGGGVGFGRNGFAVSPLPSISYMVRFPDSKR
jgi:hypothetical protein